MASNDILARLAVLISADTSKLGAQVGKAQSTLKAFQSTVQSIAGALGIAFGAVTLFRGLKAGVAIMAEFEKAMSEVRAITGATGKEFEALEKDAIRLGSSTKFTAREVAGLQVAYGRLGFNTKEILAATEATLDLAAATGEDLAKSADVAGSTLRAFGLKAKETQRVVDVMAKSFNTTALNLDNFAEGMKFVAPIAAAANVSIEETTALLGVLADAGIRGSLAGTSLRKIFTEIARDGRPVQERLAELAKKGITLKDSFDEVGRTAQTSLLVLSKNNDKSIELAKSFGDVSGEAAKMARIMQDNLTGDVTKLTSAFEGLIIKLSNSDAFRNFTQQLTELVNFVSGSGKSLDKIFKDIAYTLTESGDLNKFSNKDITANLDQYVQQLIKVRQEAGKPIDTGLIEEIANKYNLTSRAVSFLKESIDKANASLSFQEKRLKEFNAFAERNGYSDLTVAADAYIESLNKLIVAETNKQQAFKQGDIDLNTTAFAEAQAQSEETIQSYLRTIDIVKQFASDSVDANGQVIQSLGELDKEQKLVAGSLGFYKDALKKLNDEYDKTNGNDLTSIRNIQAKIAGIEELVKRLEELKKNGSFEVLINVTLDTSSLVGPIFEASIKRFEDGLKRMADAAKLRTKEIAKEFVNLSPLISGAISGIADAIGQGVAGVGSFGDNILKVVLGFAKQLGEILIATGVAMLAAKLLITNPYTAIVAGGVLVALASAASASIEKAHSNSFSGGSGVSSSSNVGAQTFGSSPVDVRLSTEPVIIKGQDLYVVLSNYEKANKFLKPG